MHPRVAELIELLELVPHPEGGTFREFFRSGGDPVARDGAERSPMTAIYFLLEAGQHSRWHAVASDEQWTFLEGEPLDLHVASPDGSTVRTIQMGPLAAGLSAATVVPGGYWQAAEPAGAYSLFACTVAPGFEYGDFSFLADNSRRAEVEGRLGELRGLV